MNTKEVEVKKSSALELGKKMLESQRQAAKDLIDQYNDIDSDFRKRVENFKKENAERTTSAASSL